jgi:glycosyltransferase involved in cell wall biosynthesis
MTACLHLVTDRDRRGAQVHAMDLAAGLEQWGQDTEVVALAPGQHGDLLDIEALGPWRRSPATLRELRQRAAGVDVVVAHGSATLSACVLGLAGISTPFVYRQISDPLFWAGSLARRSRVGAMIRRASRVVALSDGVGEVFARHYRLGRDRFVTIPNAVPDELWWMASAEERITARRTFGVDPDDIVVVYLGALVPEKGVADAVRAVASLEATTLLVVGDGPDRADLERLADSCGAKTRFTGPTDQPRTALHAADLLVLATQGGDSMPAVLIEAGLCGLPSVTTPVGAIEDVVIDEVTGRVVPVGDEGALAEAVARLVADDRRRSRLGAAARERCLSMFTIDAVTPRWGDLLENVARIHARR